MSKKAYLFPTKLGPMAVLCTGTPIEKSILPCDTVSDLENTVAKAWGTTLERALPEHLEVLCARVEGLWRGEPESFDDILLDLSPLTSFQRLVYEELRKVPQAHVVSYGELAARIGKPQAARAIGGALRVNPLPLFIPCHRVLAKTGLGGFTAPGGLGQKYVLLRAEGWQRDDHRSRSC